MTDLQHFGLAVCISR